MSRFLRPPYTNAGVVDSNGFCRVPLVHNGYENIWEVQQITVNYDVQGDQPNVQITVNGEVYSGPAVMLPGNGRNNENGTGTLGLGQTFGGYPYLYMESGDNVAVEIANGSAGANVFVRVQYRVLLFGADELDGFR